MAYFVFLIPRPKPRNQKISIFKILSNVRSEKKYSKYSSLLLLRLLYFFSERTLQGISFGSVTSKSALRGKRIHNFIELGCLVGSGGLDIWVLSISFQKKYYRLASTASDRKGAKLQHDISWFYPIFFFFKTSK